MRVQALAAAVLAASALAAASNATVAGRVVDEKGQPVPRARIRLENKVTGYRQAALSDGEGRYTLFNIPFNDYHLEVEASGMQDFHRNLELRFSLPVDLEVRLKAAGAVVEVVEETRLVEDHPSVHLDIDQSTIDRIPSAVRSRALESILLATPGFIADENGRFHFRGSHGQMTFVVDGVPVSDQLHATFSNSLDPAQVDSMEVITGGVGAEYGGKPVVVVNITSKSGLGTPGGFEGEASAGGARFRTFETGLNLRGGTDAFGYFVNGAASTSARFLDPVDFRNLHNRGRTGRASGRFDWILTEADTLRLSASGGRTAREVANLASQEERGQDQRASTADANLSLAWSHLFSPTTSLDATLFQRTASARLDPSEDLQEGFGAAPRRDLPVWARQARTLDNRGLLLAVTSRWGKEHTLKAGLQALAFPIHEDFRFALTGPGPGEDPADPLHPYTAAGGGRIFHFEGRTTPRLTSAFVQNDLHLGDWFVATGLRYDHYRVEEATHALFQPRIGASYALRATGTVLRASYDRLLIIRENENLALSLSQRAWDLGPYRGTPRPPARPELQHSFSCGVEQQAGRGLRLGLEYWEKASRNAGDSEQFLNTGVLFPVSADRASLRGMNLRADLVPVQGWSGYLSLGRTRAIFQAPLVGGLQLDLPERRPGERFLIDHDQKLAAQAALRWEGQGAFLQVIGRYDSGLVAGDPAAVGADPDYAFGTAFVRRDGEGTWRIAPRSVWSLGGGWTFPLQGRRSLQAGGDLLNAFGQRGLYNFLSAFGGTHVIPPRTLALRLKYRF